MRRLVTKLSLVLSVIVLFFLVSPYFFGFLIKRTTFQFLAHENQTLGNVIGVHMTLDNYERGWFESTAMLQIEKRDENNHWEIENKIPVTLSHGPLYHSDGQFDMGLGMLKGNAISSDNFPYRVTIREKVSFHGARGALVFAAKKTGAFQPNFQMDSLVVNTQTNATATDFAFNMVMQGVHFQDPTQSLTFNAQNLQTAVTAHFLGDRHWAMVLDLGSEKDQLTAMLPNNVSTLTVNADQINFKGVHFDTEKFAKILAELVQLKQAADANQPMRPTAWMALAQQVITQIIQKDTTGEIKGLAIVTPMGQLDAKYSVSFPALPMDHDYFDVATSNVGALEITVPSWKYQNSDTNAEFALNNFRYADTNNTVFARHAKITLGAFDFRNGESGDKAVNINGSGLTYEGSLTGDTKKLSQVMGWHLSRLCFTDSCFDKIQGSFELLNMDFSGFRGIAGATQKIVQYDPAEDSKTVGARWEALADAYMKLVTPNTQLLLSHDMMTPAGELQMQGKVTWPDLKMGTAAAPVSIDDFLNQTVYQFNMTFPATYVDSFLQKVNATSAAPQPAAAATPSADKSAATAPADSVATPKEPPVEAQMAQFIQYAISEGYLKKVGDAYTLGLSGKGSVMTINGILWKPTPTTGS